jgi:hypothetical protein
VDCCSDIQINMAKPKCHSCDCRSESGINILQGFFVDSCIALFQYLLHLLQHLLFPVQCPVKCVRMNDSDC